MYNKSYICPRLFYTLKKQIKSNNNIHIAKALRDILPV